MNTIYKEASNKNTLSNYLLYAACISAAFLYTNTAYATTGFTDPDGFVETPLNRLFLNLTAFINETLVPFALALAFFVFIWGVFQYFIAGGANEEKRESGKQLMIYSVLGFTLIVIIYGLVNFIDDVLGLDTDTPITIPQNPSYTPPR